MKIGNYQVRASHVVIAVLAVILLVGLVSISGCVSTLNDEASGRYLVTTQQTVVKSYDDKMWKIIQQKAQISEQYKEQFLQVYQPIMSERYSGKNPLFSFVAEHQPSFTPALMQDLSRAVESLREDLTSQEVRLTDLNRAHNLPFDQFPTNVIYPMFGRQKTTIVLITSDQTNKTFNNGGVETTSSLNVFGSQ
jgi:hypothetical protein